MWCRASRPVSEQNKHKPSRNRYSYGAMPKLFSDCRRCTTHRRRWKPLSQFGSTPQTYLYGYLKLQAPLPETLPESIIALGRVTPLSYIFISHLTWRNWTRTQRLKFEELFYIQLSIFIKIDCVSKIQRLCFCSIMKIQWFYKNYLAFELTNAQKKRWRNTCRYGYRSSNELIATRRCRQWNHCGFYVDAYGYRHGFQACLGWLNGKSTFPIHW